MHYKVTIMRREFMDFIVEANSDEEAERNAKNEAAEYDWEDAYYEPAKVADMTIISEEN